MPKKDKKEKSRLVVANHPKGEGIGKVEPRAITQEMEESYLDYAMSVIISRALPDVRDGLKPVHRRILYAMWNMGLKPGAKTRKSATVVGEVMGKYHPHGDIAIYDSMVHMIQDFSMRYPLIAGQGNFGSVDGDAAAAMRYTEAKLAPVAEEVMQDIEKETVDFVPNYDGTLKEPQFLPAKLPNFLLNGTMGIAVGMATNIPPHNLGELCDGIRYLVDHPQSSVEELMQFIKAPDFPTGGIIFDREEIKRAYATGKGGIVMRAKAGIAEKEGGYFRIIVQELPYQVNKASLLEKIASLVKEKRIDGIKDLRDESSKGEIRIIIDLKKDAYPKKVLNQLFKLTQLQDVFHINILAIIGGIQPQVLTLKMALEYYIEHRKLVIKRRTEFELRRTKERVHILKGFKIALTYLDEIIKTIKRSRDREVAKVNLIKKFCLTEVQAQAILEMRLHQLANLERLKILDELKEKQRIIKKLEKILDSPKEILKIIKEELEESKNKFADVRRTQIISSPVDKFTPEDLVPDEPTIITITRDGYIKRLLPEAFRTQIRGGKGVIGLAPKEGDVVEHFFTTTTHSNLLFFSTSGKVFQLKAYDVPVASRTAKGQAIQNFLQISSQEKISAVLSFTELKDFEHLVMVTKKGLIKKVAIRNFENVRRSGLIAIKLREGDELRWAKASGGKDEIILITKNGQSIRFYEKDIRPMGRGASGVRGIRLKGDDKVVGMGIIMEKVPEIRYQLLVIMENGFGKRSSLKNYRRQYRGGSGIKTAKITQKTGKIVSAGILDAKEKGEKDLIIISSHGQVIRLPIQSVSILGRATQGVRLMKFKGEDRIASVTFV
ncbi:MAG: DNA gyrase subunit A [Parcubacteria group bacterium CG23_combo_of_CG06-09_8_20_14_all_35_9]|nr:MAG: DNA gyrase subunit A [Parcubacteria group bacterium CG23_combo_of_CG06-09_8_20_14_all_35_9]